MTPDDLAPLISVENVTKDFGHFRALDDVSMVVRPGHRVVIIGPSGSGKSTLLRCINGLESITSGRIIVDGLDVADPKTSITDVRVNVGMVFQHFNLFPHKTVLQNLMLGPVKVRHMPAPEARELAMDLLARVGLTDKGGEHPARLSGGQQQRVAIARALAMRPKAILFDEPTSALDPELVGEVLEVMRGLANEGTTMIVVTHEMAFAEDVADEVIIMDVGKIIERGRASEVLRSPETLRARAFLARLLDRNTRHPHADPPRLSSPQTGPLPVDER